MGYKYSITIHNNFPDIDWEIDGDEVKVSLNGKLENIYDIRLLVSKSEDDLEKPHPKKVKKEVGDFVYTI